MAGPKTTPLDPKVVDKLLDLLSADNEFRRLFKKDPKAALIKAGVKDATALGSACYQVARIAPKEDVIRARDSLREMFLAGLSQNPIQLDAASNTRRTTK